MTEEMKKKAFAKPGSTCKFVPKKQRMDKKTEKVRGTLLSTPSLYTSVATVSAVGSTEALAEEAPNDAQKSRRGGRYHAKFGRDLGDDTLGDDSLFGDADESDSSGIPDAQSSRATHWTVKSLDEMTERDWRIFREDYSISVSALLRSGGPAGGAGPALSFRGIRAWEEEVGRIDEGLVRRIQEAGRGEPTPIQRQAISVALEGKDAIGVAETGSGKTMAFLVPLIQYVLGRPGLTEETLLNGPYALIMTPTRELALQIAEELDTLMPSVGTPAAVRKGSSCVVIGGVAIEKQAAALRRGCEIVVATPGRLVDCLEQSYIVLSQAAFVVLDEADKMLSMGFEEPLKKIRAELPAERRNLMFSATMSPQIERLASLYLSHPSYLVSVTAAAADTDALARIREDFRVLDTDELKLAQLEAFLDRIAGKTRVILFCNTRASCDELFEHLRHLDSRRRVPLNPVVIHSSKKQDAREAAIDMLKRGDSSLLIATDVASRGIHIPHVQTVLNFDMPLEFETYIHRIGRTGRAGASGTSVTFLTPHSIKKPVLDLLISHLRSKNVRIPPHLLRLAKQIRR